MSNELQVNTYFDSSQDSPVIASFSDGGFIVAWESYNQDGGGNGIYAQCYSVNSIPDGAAFRINTTISSHQQNPDLTVLTNDNLVVVWESYYQDSDGYGVYVQLFDHELNLIGGEILVNSYTDSHQRNASVESLSDAKFVIVWDSNEQDGSGTEVYAQIHESNGDIFKSEFLVNTSTLYDQGYSEITVFDDSFLISWKSEHPGNDVDNIYAQRYDLSGDPINTEFQINSLTPVYENGASIIELGNGGFVAIWESASVGGGSDGIHAQVFDANDVAIGDEFLVNEYTSGYQKDIDATLLNNGNYVITWSSRYQDGSGYGIYAKIFNSENISVKDEFQINTETAGSQLNPSIAALSAGGFAITWESDNQDGDSLGVFAQQFDANGIAIEAQNSSNNSSVPSLVEVTVVATDQFVIGANSNLEFESLPSVVLQGNIQEADSQNLYRLTVEANTTVILDIDFLDGDTLTDSVILLFDADLNILASNDDGYDDTSSYLEFLITQTGDYYVGVGGYESDVGTYTLNISKGLFEITPNHTPTANDDTTTVLTANTITIDALANDLTSAGSGVLSVETVSAINGTVTVNIDNTIDYTPNANFIGTDVVTYTISDTPQEEVSHTLVFTNAEVFGSYYDDITTCIDAAIKQWEQYLTTYYPVDITLNITGTAQDLLASAGAYEIFDTNIHDPASDYHIEISGVQYEISTGIDLNGPSTADGEVSISTKYLDEFWFDPTPYDLTDNFPNADQYDFRGVIMHEFAHVLGFNGNLEFRPNDINILPNYWPGYLSNYDTFINWDEDLNSFIFTGENAVSAYHELGFSGNLPIYSQGYVLGSDLYHYGLYTENYSDYINNPLNFYLMSYSAEPGQIYNINSLDLGILKDLKYNEYDNTATASITVEITTNQLTGTATDDILNGTAGIDNITTLEGADVVYALAGNDTINLSADSIWSSSYAAQNVSNDTSVGTHQKIDLAGLNRFSDVIDGGADIDTLNLTDGNDAFFIEDIYSDLHPSFEDYFATALVVEGTPSSVARIVNLEVINAGEGNDIVDLTSSHYILANAIEINGEAGNDILWGSNGDDTINGGDGNDTINGGTGFDDLSGGTGADIFQFTATSGSDDILDFDIIQDSIQLCYRAGDDHTNADLSLSNGVLTWDVLIDDVDNVVIDLSATVTSSDLNDLDALISFVEIV